MNPLDVHILEVLLPLADAVRGLMVLIVSQPNDECKELSGTHFDELRTVGGRISKSPMIYGIIRADQSPKTPIFGFQRQPRLPPRLENKPHVGSSVARYNGRGSGMEVVSGMAKHQFIRLGIRQGWGGAESPFHISEEALRRHLYVVGKTGTGKTTLLKALFLRLVEEERGVAIVDPHGDLAEELLDLLPPHLASRVVYFNPADLSFPFAWNIMANVTEDDRPRVASGIVSAFKNVWGDSWGPRLEYILYNSIRALLDAEGTSILGLPKMLTDEAYRRWVWQDEFENYDKRFRQEAIAPIQNKVGALTTNPALRNILGQSKRKLDIPFVMERGRVLIANLSKGALGDEPSNLIGSLLVSEFERAAMARGSQLEVERQDFTLIIDEFQNFTTNAFASILSEARKYRLSLVLSHQFTSQLEPGIRDAVFGNIGTTIAFQLGATDADLMAKEYGGAFAASHFVDLERFRILAKPCPVDGLQQPFRARSEHSPSPNYNAKGAFIRSSRDRYGSLRETVEDKIGRWMERWSENA
jgi:energy-coupling factor transporter ATP-binding protein EcfA2